MLSVLVIVQQCATFSTAYIFPDATAHTNHHKFASNMSKLTPLSWWIALDQSADLSSALKHYSSDQLEHRILSLILAQTTKSSKLPKRRRPVSFSRTLDYSRIKIYIYRPKFIYIPKEHADFQDDHLLILLTDHPLAPDVNRDDFATHLLDNLRSDEFFATDEGAHRSQNPERANPLGVMGVTKMWSGNERMAHAVNVEVFGWSHPWKEGVLANVQGMEDATKQLPGQAERVVLVELQETKNMNAVRPTTYEVVHPGEAGAGFIMER